MPASKIYTTTCEQQRLRAIPVLYGTLLASRPPGRTEVVLNTWDTSLCFVTAGSQLTSLMGLAPTRLAGTAFLESGELSSLRVAGAHLVLGAIRNTANGTRQRRSVW